MEGIKSRVKFIFFMKRYGRIIIAGTVLVIIMLIAIFAPLIATHDPYKVDIYKAKITPNDEHIMGTDAYGRDIFSRIVYGTRTSLIISLSVNALAIIIGTIIGLMCGYFIYVDRIVMRIMEALNALPMLLLAIVFASVLGPGVDKLIICLTIVNLPGIARLVRSQVLSLKEKEFIESATASGASNLRIIFKYILPLCYSPLIIRFTNGLSATILTQSTLSFLGVGLDSRIPTWGGIIGEGRAYVVVYPHMCTYAGLAIVITVLAFSIFGDGVRDVLDPKLR